MTRSRLTHASGAASKWRLALFLVALAPGARCQAHLVTTGLGPIYDGIGHLLLSPEQWMAIAGVGLLAGLNGVSVGRVALAALPLGWLLGGGLGFLLRMPLPELLPAITLLGVGSIVATDPCLNKPSMAVAAGGVGLLHGSLTATAFRPVADAVLALLGSAVAASVGTILISSMVIGLQAGWKRILVRVMGSWLASIGLLLVGWALRQK